MMLRQRMYDRLQQVLERDIDEHSMRQRGFESTTLPHHGAAGFIFAAWVKPGPAAPHILRRGGLATLAPPGVAARSRILSHGGRLFC